MTVAKHFVTGAISDNRASKLEINLSEALRELDMIRESPEKAERRASTDILTGIPNRRAFDEFLHVASRSAAALLNWSQTTLPKWRAAADKNGHYSFAAAL